MEEESAHGSHCPTPICPSPAYSQDHRTSPSLRCYFDRPALCKRVFGNSEASATSWLSMCKYTQLRHSSRTGWSNSHHKIRARLYCDFNTSLVLMAAQKQQQETPNMACHSSIAYIYRSKTQRLCCHIYLEGTVTGPSWNKGW